MKDRKRNLAGLALSFAVLLAMLFFFEKAHPLVILDADDWAYLSVSRIAVPAEKFWNPARIFPEILEGLEIRKTEDSYAIMTRPSQKKILDRMFGPRQVPPLSQASYETLAVIAYNQPCTRAQVELVRGVSSDSIISRLLDRGWIEEAGNLDAPGRPSLFKTSRKFLTEFGIESVKDLPPLELMSYQTIRDMEDSLKEAAGGEDKQISIESLMAPKPENEEGEENDGDA